MKMRLGISILERDFTKFNNLWRDFILLDDEIHLIFYAVTMKSWVVKQNFLFSVSWKHELLLS